MNEQELAQIKERVKCAVRGECQFDFTYVSVACKDAPRLIEEVERLREALQKIQAGFHYHTSFDVMKIASNALEGGSNDDRRNL